MTGELQRARSRILRATVNRLVSSTRRAAEVLLEVASDPDAHPAQRIAAAKAILEYAFKAQEQDDIVARLDALEERI